MGNLTEFNSETIYWNAFCGNASLYHAFWSTELLFGEKPPDVTLCFQSTVVTWVQCGAFLFLSPWFFHCIRKLPRDAVAQRSYLNLSKIIVGIILSFVYFLQAILMLVDKSHHIPAETTARIIFLLVTVVATLLSAEEYRRGLHTSCLLSVFWLVRMLSSAVMLRSYVLINLHEEGIWSFVLNVSEFISLMTMLTLHFIPDVSAIKRQHWMLLSGEVIPLLSTSDERLEMEVKDCPYETASFFSRLTFAWIAKIFLKAKYKDLEYKDIYKLRNIDKTQPKGERFLHQMFNSYQGSHVIKWPRLWIVSCLIKTCYFRVLMILMCDVVLYIALFLMPLVLEHFIIYLNNRQGNSSEGYVCAVGLFTLALITVLFTQRSTYHNHVLSLQVKAALSSAIFWKALHLSNIDRRKRTVGDVINMIAVDTNFLALLSRCFKKIFTFLATFTFSTWVLYIRIGPIAFMVPVILGILLPAVGLLVSAATASLENKASLAKERRLQMMAEILNGIKTIKLFTWETVVERRLGVIRDRETQELRRSINAGAINGIMTSMSPYLVMFLVLGLYPQTDPNHQLTPQLVFVLDSLIGLMQSETIVLPYILSLLNTSLLSLKKLAAFFMMDEVDSNELYQEKEVVASDMEEKDMIDLINCNCTSGLDAPILTNINLRVREGELVMVVGPVGSGKSALLSTILRQLDLVSGTITVKGSIAFTDEQPWILNASIRENILLGKKYRHTDYQNVISACALTSDLIGFPAGDGTELTERGQNLSGGQRQRISLARALYQDRDIYLLDNPLSSVDNRVASHIFSKVLSQKGLLQHKTRVFVTHNTRHLQLADKIVMIKDGRVAAIGSYTDLKSTNKGFVSFLNDNKKRKAARKEEPSVHTDSRLISESEEWFPILRTMTMSQADECNFSEGLPLIQEESISSGKVSFKVALAYMKACTLKAAFTVIACQVAYILLLAYSKVWQAHWATDFQNNQTQFTYRTTVYGVIGLGQTIVICAEAMVFVTGAVAASSSLFKRAVHSLLGAQMSFFTLNPISRILNRFSNDMNEIDVISPLNIRLWLMVMSPLMASLLVILYTFPIMFLVLIPLSLAFICIKKYFVHTINRLQCMENVRLSQVFAHCESTLSSIASVRAYNQVNECFNKYCSLVDNSQIPRYLCSVGKRWVGLLADILGCLLLFATSIIAVHERGTFSVGLVALAVTSTLQLTSFVSNLLRDSTDLECNLVSVGRILDYMNLTQESFLDTGFVDAPKWPQEGVIEFDNLCTRYRPGTDLALKYITCQINAREKIAIVGRTGAGKSSMSMALFRLLEPTLGCIRIDGMNISDVILQKLRRSLTIIPQENALYSGSIRENLNPFNKYDDDQIWRALNDAHVSTLIEQLPGGLDFEIRQSDDKFSAGQKQLICLARALLSKNKILIMDEATAAVDSHTDILIQQTVRTHFKDCTIITIAHRIESIIDYDRVMVLEAGRIVEFDNPYVLLDDKNSKFYKLARTNKK